MKKIILTILFSFFYLNNFSQDRIPVTIVKTDGTELNCYISTFQGKIISEFSYKLWINDEKFRIDRSEIREIITEGNKYINIEYLRKTRRGGQLSIEKIKRTAELLLDENIKLYAVHIVRVSVSTLNNITTPTGSYLETSHFLVSNNETTFINKMNFKKVIKNYFSNCDKLNLKIKSKELKYNQIKEAVLLGNNCLNNYNQTD
jgi:hypothetical protein